MEGYENLGQSKECEIWNYRPRSSNPGYNDS